MITAAPLTVRDINRAQPPTTRRETIHGGSTPASMRLMVVDRCLRFMSLTVNGTAVIIVITAAYLR